MRKLAFTTRRSQLAPAGNALEVRRPGLRFGFPRAGPRSAAGKPCRARRPRQNQVRPLLLLCVPVMEKSPGDELIMPERAPSFSARSIADNVVCFVLRAAFIVAGQGRLGGLGFALLRQCHATKCQREAEEGQGLRDSTRLAKVLLQPRLYAPFATNFPDSSRST
jgi:hypothetical protein